MRKCFNTIKGPKAVGPYSTCVITDNAVYLSGMLPIIPETGELAAGGADKQAEQALENIKTVLSEIGLTFQNCVKTTVLLKDMNDFAAVNAVYEKYFAPDFPARTCFQVAKLPKDADLEIELICTPNI